MGKPVRLKWPHGNGNGSVSEVLEDELELQKFGKAGQRPPRWEKQNESRFAGGVRPEGARLLTSVSMVVSGESYSICTHMGSVRLLAAGP